MDDLEQTRNLRVTAPEARVQRVVLAAHENLLNRRKLKAIEKYIRKQRRLGHESVALELENILEDTK